MLNFLYKITSLFSRFKGQKKAITEYGPRGNEQAGKADDDDFDLFDDDDDDEEEEEEVVFLFECKLLCPL